jgi:MFS superfamily sulfate permease-like transporter
MNGIALTVLISQLPKFFGFGIDDSGPLRELWAIGSAILDGKANWAAFSVGAGTLAAILLLKSHIRFPGILVAVAGATVIAALLDLKLRAGLSVLGPLPQGLPTFAVPWINYSDIVPVLIGGGAVAVISFADTSVLSRTYAARLGARLSVESFLHPTRATVSDCCVGLAATNAAFDSQCIRIESAHEESDENYYLFDSDRMAVMIC